MYNAVCSSGHHQIQRRLGDQTIQGSHQKRLEYVQAWVDVLQYSSLVTKASAQYNSVTEKGLCGYHIVVHSHNRVSGDTGH